MKGYFYHGSETNYGAFSYSCEKMLKVLSEGLKNRKDARDFNDVRYNHVCLYKKMKTLIIMMKVA